MKKKIFILFMSHNSGDHGLTTHNTIEELKAELKSVIDLINADMPKRDKRKAENLNVIEEVCDGYYAELSDSTWFDVFEREV